jgi:catechol 2,3-dioxygenase-like lactoylglutathione lyase family enzyme
MIDHVTLQVGDVAASRDFYAVLLAPLGLRPAFNDGEAVGFSDGERAPFWLCPARADEARELHIGFVAASEGVVDAFHRAALEVEAEILHAPRAFPEYGPHYYAAFVRDLDGHNIEAVCRTGAGA